MWRYFWITSSHLCKEVGCIHSFFFFVSIWNSLMNTRYFCIWLTQVYVLIEIIFVYSFLVPAWWGILYKTHNFRPNTLPAVIIDVCWYINLVKVKDFVVFWSCSRIEVDSNRLVYDIPETFSATRLGVEDRKFHVRSCNYHFKTFLRWSSWITVISTSRSLDWGVILSAKTLWIVSCFSLYIFCGGPMG